MSQQADVILVNTCAIREKAEQKIWDRLDYFKSLKRKQRNKKRLPHLTSCSQLDVLTSSSNRVVGILGCMAERLKTQLLEAEKMVDLVVGPDAYRSLPALLTQVDDGQTAMNVQLSLDETYADITPIRHSSNDVSAYM